MIRLSLYLLQLIVGLLIAIQLGAEHSFSVGMAVFVVIWLLADIQFLLRKESK